MINLMPTESKRQIKAARINTLLIRYTLILFIAGVFVAIILAGSYFLLTQQKAASELLIEASDTKAQAYSNTQAEIASLSGNLSGARTVLDEQLLYSKALTNLASVMPAGTIIGNVSLKPESFGSAPATLEIYAATNEAATTLQSQFQSSPYFTNVQLDSITTEEEAPEGYPYSATLTATFTRSIAQ